MKWRDLTPSARVGAAMIGAFVVVGIIGPWIAPYRVDQGAIDLEHIFEAPSGAHWLGRDKNGIDTLSQLLWGARAALEISSLVVGITAVIGVYMGTISGFYRGLLDDATMRVVDILMSFPGILLNIAVVATVAHPGLGVVVAALCVNGWVGYARVARSQVLSLREREYVLAARTIGASDARIMFRHLVPNLIAPTIVQMTFGFGTVIGIEATLSFLGLGTQVDYSWGSMLDTGTTFFWKPGFKHYALVAGGAIAWVILGANLLGDGLRDYFDPKRVR